MRVVIIGAGPGGICMGVNLKRAGFHDFTILEKAPAVGGTWWHNTYPGAECDIQSHLYSFSFALKPDWRRPYASQPEILGYLTDCVDRFGLRPHIRCGIEVQAARWDDGRSRWTLRTEGGETITCDVLVSAVGMFNHPAYPKLRGLETFSGRVFHSARWQHDHDLQGRSVALVGSAASAVQIAPQIAPVVRRLVLFQRTGTWVLPKEDALFDDATLEERRRNPVAAKQLRVKILRQFQALSADDSATIAKAERAGLQNISVVKDPEVRAKLTPNFPFGRKRPLLSNQYYPIFNLDHVELVTTGIEHVQPDGIVSADGTVKKVDTMILATGFETSRFASVVNIEGDGGQKLEEAWTEGAQAYLGITTAGFPNLFMLYGPNTNAGSIIYMIESQVAYILRHLTRMRDEGLQVLRVRRSVQDRYNEQLQRELDSLGIYPEGVNTYYRAGSGRIVTQCPYTMPEYRELTSVPDPEAFDAVECPQLELADSAVENTP